MEKLERALSSWRREQALSYLQQLSGAAPEELPAQRARAFLCSEQALELIDGLSSSGELAPAPHAAVCAHLARARAEASYAEARAESLAQLGRPLQLAGETRSTGQLLSGWCEARQTQVRRRLEQALDAPFGEQALELVRARARADAAAAQALARLAPARHADAGPEGGSAAQAERWLALSADLAREAFTQAARLCGVEPDSGLDNAWAVTGQALGGLCARPGRFRRLGAELAPLGLRAQLVRVARLAPAQPGPFPACHVLPLAVPRDVRIAPASLELGLGSELAAADALGRAAALVHAAPGLPLALRHPSAASVARGAGALCVLRFAEPGFLRKRRDLSAREAGDAARLSAGYALLDSRLAAASVLARNFGPEQARERAQALCEGALLGPVPPGCALLLLTRLSAGSAFRGKLWAPALAHALRERFDEDWYDNPRAGEPLRGAFARAGELSVEAFASELGADLEHGLAKLSELF